MSACTSVQADYFKNKNQVQQGVALDFNKPQKHLTKPFTNKINKSKMRKVFAKSVTIPASTPIGSQNIEIRLDESVKRIVGFCVVETANTNNDPYQVAMSIAGETILSPANSKLYQSINASPDDKFKTLDIEAKTNVVNINVVYLSVIGASAVKFDVCLETASE